MKLANMTTDYIPDEAWKLSQQLLQVTGEEEVQLNETEHLGKSLKQVNEDADAIRNWLMNEPHLPHDIDDYRLKNFLRWNSFRLDEVKGKLDMYYALRERMPVLYKERYPKAKCIEEVTKIGYLVVMPKLTPDLERIMIYRQLPDDNNEYNPPDMYKYILMSLELRMIFDRCSGDIFFMDCANFRFRHIWKTSPFVVKNYFDFLEKAVTPRIKEIHILNLPGYCSPMISIAKSVLKSEYRHRIFLHRSLDSVYEKIPKEYLPSDYGGTEKSLDDLQTEWKSLLELMNDWFVTEGSKKSNEKLRKKNSNGKKMKQ